MWATDEEIVAWLSRWQWSWSDHSEHSSEKMLTLIIKADKNPPSWLGIIGRDTCHREQGCGLNSIGGGEPCHDKDTGLLSKELLAATCFHYMVQITSHHWDCEKSMYLPYASLSPLFGMFPRLLISCAPLHSLHLSQIYYTITFDSKIVYLPCARYYREILRIQNKT